MKNISVFQRWKLYQLYQLSELPPMEFGCYSIFDCNPSATSVIIILYNFIPRKPIVSASATSGISGIILSRTPFAAIKYQKMTSYFRTPLPLPLTGRSLVRSRRISAVTRDRSRATLTPINRASCHRPAERTKTDGKKKTNRSPPDYLCTTCRRGTIIFVFSCHLCRTK